MPHNSPDFWTVVLVITVSIVSGVISILNRIAQGKAFSIVWVTSEFLAAILCGYLAFDAYPSAQAILPDWVSLPMFIAACSHTGGRLLQILGDIVTANAEKFGGGKR